MAQQKQKQNTDSFFYRVLDHGGFIAQEACVPRASHVRRCVQEHDKRDSLYL
jgi:hypothetical protein